ncbi:MAG: hypothetical protein ABMA15_02255 [Vicinamibacterales bacterium]
MFDFPRHDTSASLYRAGVAVLATLVLTSAHHLYGARRFDTPWRAHVAHIATWAGVIFGLCFLVALLRSHERTGRIAMTAFVVLAMTICVLWLGLYEGGYDHGLKNLAAAHLPSSVFGRLFPRSLYEPPGDWVFELSGVLQLPVGLFAGRAAWRARLAFEASR